MIHETVWSVSGGSCFRLCLFPILCRRYRVSRQSICEHGGRECPSGALWNLGGMEWFIQGAPIHTLLLSVPAESR